MSFNSNDISHTINLGNYEEFFILYMDNELNDDQVKMVDAFLLTHPDLQAEFEMLMGTRLPIEEFCFHKETLLSDNIKLNAIDEDLLLYIDNELTADKKKIVELEISSNASFKAQHHSLLLTKLNPSETIVYPDKEELYHRRKKIVPLNLWMRIAAAVIVIATAGALYFSHNGTSIPSDSTAGAKIPVQRHTVTRATAQQPITRQEPSPQLAVVGNPVNKSKSDSKINSGKRVGVGNGKKQINIARIPADENEIVFTDPVEKGETAINNASSVDTKTASFNPSKEIINNSVVTSALSPRNTINVTESTVPYDEVATSNERKGSFKSFLRKATRLIERKTGIDPTNGDDELLIGAVALKLK